jgi:hypothetical protein
VSASVLLASILIAGVDVIAVHDGEAQQATTRALSRGLGKDEVVDASALHAYLLRPAGVLPMQDFDGFSAGPALGWPTELAQTWRAGVTYCRDITGAPPWTAADPSLLPSAMCCGNRLSDFLWQKYLDFIRPARVFVLEVKREPTGIEVRGSSYEPGARVSVEVTSPSTLADLPRTLDETVAALVARRGPSVVRKVHEVLFTPLSDDPFPAAVGRREPAGELETCPALPSALSIEPQGATAEAIAGRWATSVKSSSPAMRCFLRFSEHEEPPRSSLPMDVTTVTTVLRCGNESVSVELAKGLVRDPTSQISGRMIRKLAARLCR